MPSGRRDVAALAEAIRAYLREHPSAADSADGIERWWLPPGFENVAAAEVAAALSRLCEAGELNAVRLPDGNIVYSKAQHRPTQ